MKEEIICTIALFIWQFIQIIVFYKNVSNEKKINAIHVIYQLIIFVIFQIVIWKLY